MSLRARLGFSSEPLYLMDGSAFVFRGFYAFRNMARSDGFPTNALYIVTRLILKLLREERPAHFAFILDGKGKTFRHERFPDYKAQRSATPEPLSQQIPPLHSLLTALGVPVVVSNGCEADDCIASLVSRYRDERPVVMVGADKDLKQCLHTNVVLWDPASKEEKITTLADFQEETGLAPSSWPDYQALVGDSSDNIPGIAQIGPKTALGLVQAFPTLEELFDRLPAVPPKVRPKLEGQRENALLYRELTTLQCTACPSLSLADLSVRSVELGPVLAFMEEFELRSLAREVESMARAGIFGRGPASLEAPRPGAGFIGKPGPQGKVQADPFHEGEAEAFVASSAPSGDGAASPSASAGSLGLISGSVSGPQPLTRTHKKMTQGSLFSDAEATRPPAFPAADSVAGLPPFGPAGQPHAGTGNAASDKASQAASGAGPTVFLLPMDSGLLLASAGWERLYTGPVEDVAAALQKNLVAAAKGKTPDGGGSGDAGATLSGEAAASPGLTLVTPDVKSLCKACPALWALPPSVWFDLSLAAYLLSPEDRGYSWEHLCQRWAEQGGDDHSPQEHPGLLGLALHAFMRDRLAGASLTGVFRELELPLVPVLARMEERGITVDTAAFAAFLDEVQRNLDHLTEDINRLAGRSFNIRSSQQLSDVLFTVLELPKAGKTRGGAVSTSQESLEKLSGKHPIIEAILEYRKMEKLRSTYLEPLPRLADAAGRIHTTFNQTATATGRLSSSNPNLQNIPVRGPLGGRMRGCFIAAQGMSLVCADYSQIELRVLAHLSGDPTLLDAFRKNEDIHARTAGLLFDVSLDAVTPEQRRNAKTINFGLVYGMGAQRLAQELRISLKDAKAFIERYFARLSRLKAFYDAIEEEAREYGFVATMAGRRRLTPDILSQNNQLRSQARRQAINTRIQGSAADIIKLAMIAVENDPELHSLGAKLLLQIHDELLLEAPSENARKAGDRLALLMNGVNPGSEPLSVPLLVDWGIGHTWAEAH